MADVFYCQYLTDGQIVSTGRIDEDLISMLDTGSSTLLVTTDEVIFGESYVDVTTQTVEPMVPVTAVTTLNADTDSVVSLTNLPDCTAEYYLGDYIEPNIVTIEDTEIPIASDTISDGQLDISADLAGEYTIMLSSPISLKSKVLLTVEDA